MRTTRKNFRDGEKYVLPLPGSSSLSPKFNLQRLLVPYYHDKTYGESASDIKSMTPANLLELYDPQPASDVQIKCERLYSHVNQQIIKSKYMTFEHDERDDLWRMIEEIQSKPVKTPQERHKREEYIQIIREEI